MPSAARGKLTSSFVRWQMSTTGTWHAYTWDWAGHADQVTARTVPACGRPIPRTRLGRGTSPPADDEVCQACAVEVGFRRRPLMRAAAARRRGKGHVENMSAEVRLALVEKALGVVEVKLAALEARGRADDAQTEG